MVQIRRIANDEQELWEQARELRRRILLEPLGFTMELFDREFPDFGRVAETFVAVIDHPKGQRVVGVVCLLPGVRSEGEGKLMQMAVDEQRRREGIGRQLVAELERRAFGELGLRELFCHARLHAVPFYAGLGWAVEGDEFDEAGVPHLRMVFRPTVDVSAPSPDVAGGTLDANTSDGQ
jgi:predicted GNAT family N-acyltransferase